MEQTHEAQVADEAVWQRRFEHRRAGVLAVKYGNIYSDVHWRSINFGVRRPSSPDPVDRSVPKRAWEKGMQDWRKELKRLWTETSGLGASED